MPANRIDRINSLIKSELAIILEQTIDREHFPLVTITRVVTTHDLATAKVYISLSQAKFSSFLTWSKSHIYEMQGDLNERLSIHRHPKIVFVEDATGAYVDHMEQLFRSIAKNKKE